MTQMPYIHVHVYTSLTTKLGCTTIAILIIIACTHTHTHTHTPHSRSFEDATAVVTMGEGKYYSLGLDLPVLATMSVVEITPFSHDVQRLLLRILTFPLVTVAAINGSVYSEFHYKLTAPPVSILYTASS